jgi:hypothetical protein
MRQEPDEVKISRPDLKTRGGKTQTLVYFYVDEE